MILYHYSYTYKGDCSLQNDYHKRFALAEPMLIALRKGIDAFDNLILSLLYICRADESWNEGKKSYLHNFEKDAVEAIFEYIRETEYPNDSISRLNCVYYFRDLDSAVKAVYEDWINCGDATKDEIKIKMLKVEVADGSAKDYDQHWYNCAYDAMKKQNVSEVMELARKYFSETMSETPMLETLCSSNNHILGEIEY